MRRESLECSQGSCNLIYKNMDKQLELKNIVLIGRTFEEYYRMFDLCNLPENENILDVASE